MQTEKGNPGELLPRGDVSGALAIPVDIIPAIYKESANRCLARLATLKVEDADSYKAMAELVNGLKKLDTKAEELALAAGKPFRDEAARCTTEGKLFRTPVEVGYKKGLAMMQAWKDLDDARIAREIEAQRQAQLKEEQERRVKEQERLRLEAEAKAREEMAAKKLEAATTPKQLEKAIEAGEKAQVLMAKAAEMEHTESVIPFSAPLVEIKAPVAAKGVNAPEVVTFLQYDISKLDSAFLLCDEKKLKKAILDRIVKPGTPGVVFTIGRQLKATGR